MRFTKKATALLALAMMAIAGSGIANASGFDRDRVGLRIGNVSIGFTTDACAPVYMPEAPVIVRDYGWRDGHRFEGRRAEGRRFDHRR